MGRGASSSDSSEGAAMTEGERIPTSTSGARRAAPANTAARLVSTMEGNGRRLARSSRHVSSYRGCMISGATSALDPGRVVGGVRRIGGGHDEMTGSRIPWELGMVCSDAGDSVIPRMHPTPEGAARLGGSPLMRASS